METLAIKIKSIHCYAHEESDGDEVFLKLNGKKIWPEGEKYHQMKDQSAEVNVVVPALKVNEFVEMEVWDYDFWSPNDLMGKIRMLIDKPGGPYTTDMQLAESDQMARYSIVWEILKPA